jgi:hypothetical protein
MECSLRNLGVANVGIRSGVLRNLDSRGDVFVELELPGAVELGRVVVDIFNPDVNLCGGVEAPVKDTDLQLESVETLIWILEVEKLNKF